MCSLGHVLVVEGDDVAALGERAQRGEVGVLAVPHVGGDERGAVVRALGEHAQRLAEGDRGLVGHAGQLAAAHHADNGQTGPGIHLGASLTSLLSPPVRGRAG